MLVLLRGLNIDESLGVDVDSYWVELLSYRLD